MKTIKLTGKKQADNACKIIRECLEKDELWCVDIKPYKEAKTLQQLRALFGTWYNYLSETLGYTKDELHTMHKTGQGGNGDGGWLIEVYAENPHGDSQFMWLEIFARFHNDTEKYGEQVVCNSPEFINHMKRISLSWATIDQMREYMNRIEHYYMSAGYPLPILEKFQRAYTR